MIDPAVSYTWAEVDLAHLWCFPHPPEAKRFFDVYAELTSLDDDWRARMPLIQLRQHLAFIAQFDHDWGAAPRCALALRSCESLPSAWVTQSSPANGGAAEGAERFMDVVTNQQADAQAERTSAAV